MKTTIDVGIVYVGKGFREEHITNELNLLPTKSWNEGDLINYRTIMTEEASDATRKKFLRTQGKHSNTPNSYRKSTKWELSTGKEISLDVNEQLKKIFDILNNKVQNILEINNKYNVKPQISIVIEIVNDESPSIFLDSQIVDFINEIRGSIDIELYHV